MMKRNLRKKLKNTIISAALVCTIIANSISPSFAVDSTPETVAGQEEADNSASAPALPAEDSPEAVGQAAHVYPDGEKVVGEFDKLKKTAEALKNQLEGKTEKFTLNLSMDTDTISQYREKTWPAVKAEVLKEKGIEDDPNLPDERSDSEIMKDMILESLFLLDEVDKTDLQEGQTKEDVLRDKLVKNAGQDVSDGLKQEYSVLEINAEEIMPETIDTVFYTSLYFNVKYEQDTDGQEEKTIGTTEEKTTVENTTEATEVAEAKTTESAAKNETTAVASGDESEESGSNAEKSTVFSRGLFRSSASLFGVNDPETDVTINFLTADFVSGAKSEDGRYVWTPTNQSSDHMFVFRVNYSISGVGDIAENEFQITIPKQILRDKEGNFADYFALSVPQKDASFDDTDANSEYAFREEGDNLVIFNCKEITAAQNGYFDIGYSTTKYTYQYMDMADSDPFVARLNVDGKSAATDEIPVVINTTAVIQSTQKYYPDFYREWQSSWGTAPADAGDYYYLVWMIATYINTPTQEYNFSLEDAVSSRYGSVEVAGYRMSGRSGYSMDNTVTGLHIGGYRYDYVLTRHPKTEFQDLDFYQIDNKVTAIVDPADGVDADTTAVSSRSFQWSKPTFTIPTGHFNIWKYGNENWYQKFRYYWDYASYELDKLQKQEVSSLDQIKYYVEATGYPYPWTLEKGKYSNDPTAYGKNPVTYTITDDTLYLVDEDDTLFKSEDYEEPEDPDFLSPEDYDFEYLTYSISMTDAVYNEENKRFDLSTHSKNSQDILTFYVKADGEWKEAGTVNLGTGACSITDAHVSALTTDRIDFTEGVDGYRLETTNAYWNTTFYIYPYVSLKGTERVLDKVQDKDAVLLKNVDNLSVTYDGDFDGSVDEEIVNISKVIGDRLRRIEKSSSLQKDVVSTSNNVRKKYYDIGWRISEEEIMTTGKGEKSYIYQNGGVFYDLLPKGCTLRDGTVAVETEQGYLKDSEFSYETTADYNGSGRILLTVTIKPQAQYYRIYFHTSHPWDSIKDYGADVLNPAAYETGNEEITDGYPDNGGTLDEPEKNYMTDLDKATEENRFLYAKNTHWINALTAAISGLDKKVMTAKDSDWSYSTMTEPDGTYMYRWRFANNFTSSSKDLVFFDSLENYKVNGVTESEWNGTLQRIDLTQLKLKGIEPVVYLSSVEGLNLESNHDLTDSSVWVRMEDFGDIQDAKAVAIDMRKKSDGTDFELRSGESVTAVLYMKAPSSVPENATDYPETYNNIYIADTVVDQEGGEFPYFIHQDYTTVKYRITGKFSLEKVSEDDADEKVEGISFRLSGTSDYGTEVNIIKETDQDGWIGFKDIEKGTYVLQEYGSVPDWLEDHTEHEVIVHGDSSVTIDGADYTNTPIVITNKPRIHTDVSFLKKDLTKKTKSLAGAKFKLSGTSDYGNEILMYATSDENGQVVFKNVELGTFELKEIEAPAGYVADPNVYTVVVDENANFSISSYQKTESSETVTKYSHTPNVGDDGTKNSNYTNSMSTNEVVKIDGAESLHVKIVYGGESASYDWVCMWQGDHSDYTASSNYSSSVTGKLGGGSYTSASNTKEYDVEGDTITFAFRSDSSGFGDGYGYYAVITGEVRSSFEGMKSLETDKRGNLLFYDEPLHSFRLVKKSSYDGNTVSGATFQLKGVSDYGTTVDMTDTSETNGFVDFTGLEAGSYTLVETKAPGGFRLDETKRIVTISRTGEVAIEGLSLNEYGNFDVINQMIPERQITVIKKWRDNASPEERVLPVIHIAGEEPQITYSGEATIGMSQWSSMKSALSMTGTAVTFQQSTERSYAEKIKRTHPNAQKVDNGTTDKSIYVWKDEEGNFYWWTDAEKAYFAADLSSMFYNCSSLTSLDVSGFDTSNVTSMYQMFYNCNSLTSLDVSGFDTSNVTNMYGMFCNCISLTNLDVSGFDTSNVTSMSDMFSGCSSLTSLDVSGFDTSNVTNMSYMFSGCSSLTSLDVSGFDTSNVTNMCYMFYNCSSLTNLDVSGFDTSNVTNMCYMFYNCSSLTNLDVSGFDTSNVTNMRNMFWNCYSLTSLDVSGFDTSNVTDMRYMFCDCYSLTTIYASDLWTTASVTSSTSMFFDCTNLPNYSSSVTDKTNAHYNTGGYLTYKPAPSTAKTISNLFAKLTNLEITSASTFATLLKEDKKENKTEEKYQNASVSLTKGESFSISSLINDKEGKEQNEKDSIFAQVFDDIFLVLEKAFNEIRPIEAQAATVVPSDATASGTSGTCTWYISADGELVIGPTDGDEGTMASLSGSSSGAPWYSNRTSITSARFEGTVHGSSNCKYMFYNCSKLTSLDVSGFDTAKVTDMGCMFYYCSNLTSLDVSGFDTAKVTYMGNMFRNCSGLTSLDLSGFDTAKVTNMDSMFRDCSKLTSLDVSGFDTSNVKDMGYMFSGCSSLTSLDVSGFDTSKVTNMGAMFYGCSSLTSLDMSGFDTAKVTYMDYMFRDCSKLTSLDMSGFDTAKVTYMHFMFSGCSSLTSLDVSGFDTSKVKSMNSMFEYCSSLTSLDVSGFDTVNVTSMGYMFQNCSSLTSLDVSGFDTANVTNMGAMFYGCSSLTSLDMSGFDTSKVTYMDYMFRDCSKLTSLDMSGFDTSKVTYMHFMFSGCSKLSKIKLGETFRFKGKSITSSSNQALLPTPSPTGTEDGAYTGNWTRGTPYNHADAVTAAALRDTYDGAAMADTWYWEKNGEEPLWQSYTSISSRVFDPNDFTVTEDMTEEQKNALTTAKEQLLASYQVEDADGNAGYWTHIDDNTDMYTFYVYDADIDWYVWEDDAGMGSYIIDHDLTDPVRIPADAADKTATITNRTPEIPEEPENTGSLSLTKHVIYYNGNDIEDLREFTFYITLTDGEGKALSGSTLYGDTVFVNGKATVNLTDEQTVTIDGIPENYNYSITEAEKTGYTSVIDQPEGIITKDTTAAVSATNTREEPPALHYVDVVLEKKVTGRYETAEEDYPFYAALNGLEPEKTYSLSSGTTFASDASGTADITIRLKADESVTIQQIPVNATYSITEEAGDYTSSYKITDDAGLSKIRKDSDSTSEKNKQLSTMEETADDGESVKVTFTNTVEKTQNLKLAKKVLSKSGAALNDENEYSVEVAFANLIPNGKYLSTIGPVVADDDGSLEMTVSIRNNEEILFYDLPVGTTYRFTELANDKTGSYQITDANGGTNIVSPSGANDVENKDIATQAETVNENEEATVTFINTSAALGSIKLIKKDDQTLLSGVTFQLYDSEGGLISEKTTDAAGEVLFEELEPGTYTAKETQTVKGHTLLAEPITIEVPFVISKTDAEAAGVDTSNAVYSEKDDTYSFYDVVYTVTNDTSLDLPHTGDPKANLLMAVWLITCLGLLLLSGKKLKEE